MGSIAANSKLLHEGATFEEVPTPPTISMRLFIQIRLVFDEMGSHVNQRRSVFIEKFPDSWKSHCEILPVNKYLKFGPFYTNWTEFWQRKELILLSFEFEKSEEAEWSMNRFWKLSKADIWDSRFPKRLCSEQLWSSLACGEKKELEENFG